MVDEKPTRSARGLSRGKSVACFAIIAALLVVLDRVTKIWAATCIPSGGSSFIPGFIGFELVFNRGASFGIMQGAQNLFVAITLAVCVILLVYLIRRRRHALVDVVGLSLVFAGAIGNCYDRLFYGQVTDFLHFEFFDFPVFNVADTCITIGVVIWILFLVLHPMSPFARERDEESGGEQPR